MPTELEELVGFLHHGNTQIRTIAAENLVGYSTSEPTIFKKDQLLPVRDLKLLVRDYKQIAQNALTILINLSDDPEVLENIATDDAFLETLLLRISKADEPHPNLIAMLLANMAKSDSMKQILGLSRNVPKPLSSSAIAMDQLMDCFVKGADGTFNKSADYDYLAYFFADIAKHPEGRKYFTTIQEYDGVVPITKIIVFTEHKSHVRRKGVASTIKNTAFDTESHANLLDKDEVDLLPYILLPLMGSEDYNEEESNALPETLQLLDPGKRRDSDNDILVTHLETLLLLTTTRPGRDLLKERYKIYPLIRECHLHVEHENVRDTCDRLVQVLLRDEEDETVTEDGKAVLPQDGTTIVQAEANGDQDEDEKITEVY